MDPQPWHDYNGESADALFALAATHRIDSLVVAFEMAKEYCSSSEDIAGIPMRYLQAHRGDTRLLT